MGVEAASIPAPAPSLNRPLLQPTCNPPTSLHRYDQPSISLNNKPSLIKPPAIKRPGVTTQTQTQTNAMNMIMNANSASDQKILTNNNNNNIPKNLINTSPPPPLPVKSTSALERIKKSKSFKEGEASLTYSSSLILEAPGSIAAVRREQMALQNAQRKMRIAHYGRSKSAKFDSKVFPLSLVDTTATPTTTTSSDDHHHHHHQEENKRCSFITPNTDPVYVAYHDEEWGVPVHDDNMLFELLVLSGAQVGSDWTSILKKRQDFRGAFSGFDAETVSNFTEKQMMSISTHYNIDISRIRGVVDNSNRILEVKKEFGSLNKYIWGFVNHKAISTKYKFGHKMAVKTSKSESISKDMVRRGFRFVGPTVVHSFMQAAGLTNDHLITCHRHLPCTLLAARRLINCQ